MVAVISADRLPPNANVPSAVADASTSNAPSSRRLRLLHLYSGNLYGGVERALATFARERDACPRLAPSFALCFHDRLSRELADADAAAFDLGPVRFSRPWTLMRARARLSKLISEGRVDVVATHATWTHAAFAKTARRHGIPIVHFVHDVLAAPRALLDKWAARTAPDLTIANSHYTATTVGSMFPGARTEVVAHPVSPPVAPRRSRNEVRADLGVGPHEVVVVQASRLERWKGHTVLLEALAALRERPDWLCWIVGGPQKSGEDKYFAELKSRAQQLGIAPRVRFLGQREDVGELLGAADVLCQPNLRPEPFGIAFVEALYAGLPLVTVNVGGGAEILDETCGRLTPPGDIRATAAALDALIGDPELRRTLGGAAPARAAALCDPGRQIRRLADVINSVIAVRG